MREMRPVRLLRRLPADVRVRIKHAAQARSRAVYEAERDALTAIALEAWRRGGDPARAVLEASRRTGTSHAGTIAG